MDEGTELLTNLFLSSAKSEIYWFSSVPVILKTKNRILGTSAFQNIL